MKQPVLTMEVLRPNWDLHDQNMLATFAHYALTAIGYAEKYKMPVDFTYASARDGNGKTMRVTSGSTAWSVAQDYCDQVGASGDGESWNVENTLLLRHSRRRDSAEIHRDDVTEDCRNGRVRLSMVTESARRGMSMAA